MHACTPTRTHKEPGVSVSVEFESYCISLIYVCVFILVSESYELVSAGMANQCVYTQNTVSPRRWNKSRCGSDKNTLTEG